jgi:polar amino acid transport system substrate-binding protein
MRESVFRRRGSPGRMRWRLQVSALIACLAAVSAGFHAGAQDLGVLESGRLIVAFTGDMPMTSLRDGTLIGTDGEMIAIIAEQLGLELAPQQMDWATAIESVASGRVDVMLGAVGWTEERSEVMLLTDPIYYFGVMLAQKTSTDYSTFAEMAGKRVGTVTGFSLVPELQGVPGIGEVRLYDTPDGVLRDLVAGRLDLAILDPPLVELAIRQNPAWGLHQVPLDPEPAFPIMSTKYSATIAVRKEATHLADAINAEIGKVWEACANQRILASYGVTNPAFFVPPNPSPRVGVDRPEGWQAPTLNPACDAHGGAADGTPGP